MTPKKAPKREKRAPSASDRRSTLGRKPMFKDEAAVVAVLKAVSDEKKRTHDTCTLHNLKAAVDLHPELFAPNLKTVDGKKVEVPYSPGAVKQAVYRLVRAHKIWISRSGN